MDNKYWILSAKGSPNDFEIFDYKKNNNNLDRENAYEMKTEWLSQAEVIDKVKFIHSRSIKFLSGDALQS